MKNKTVRRVLGALVFTFACMLFGPFQISGVSAAVAVVLLAGVAMEPLYAVLSVGLYLVAGLWLPVYAGMHESAEYLFGASGGFLLSLMFCALVISALSKGMREHPVLAVVSGLCASFALYFGTGILWNVIVTGNSLTDVLALGWKTPCLLYAADALLALFASRTLYKAVK